MGINTVTTNHLVAYSMYKIYVCVCKIYLYAVALTLSFTGTKGSNLEPRRLFHLYQILLLPLFTPVGTIRLVSAKPIFVQSVLGILYSDLVISLHFVCIVTFCHT